MEDICKHCDMASSCLSHNERQLLMALSDNFSAFHERLKNIEDRFIPSKKPIGTVIPFKRK